MIKRLLIPLLALGILGLGAGLYAKDPPKKVTIDKCKKKKSAVTFDHGKHAKEIKDCKSCHHKGKEQQACSSAGCHAGKAEGKRPGCEEMSPSKNPYHIKCMGCHKKMEKGPRGCADCHK